MATESRGFEDEDEDLVLQDSELYTALTEMGLNDFECVPVQRTDFSNNEKVDDSLWSKICLPINERIYDTICNSFLSVMEDTQYLDEQLGIILRLDCLLDDHVYKIQSFINGKKECFLKRALHWLPFLGSSLTIASCPLNEKYTNILSIVLASSVFSLFAHRRFLRWTATKNLRHLIFLQNEIYISFKKILKILRYSFRMRLDSTKFIQKFIDLEKSKQMYLPPLTEIMISSLENISLLYYRAANAILKLLPTSFNTDDLITAFETESFSLKGEVTFQSLKNLYYTYLLLQSEMLHLLGIAYNRETWKNSSGCPELKLSCIINNLTSILKKHHSKILKLLNEYSSKKFIPEHKEFRGSKVSKWQDLYVHLDLTAYRLQTAYKVILSTLEEIDSRADVNPNDDFSETIMQNLNEVYKQIDTARSFTEFSTLLVAKVQHEQSKELSFKEKNSIPEGFKCEVPVVIDSEPQIFDEVFEEYIKEEYLKPIYEDGDESVVQNYKFDKLLAKNFMSELKDALIEKHKSMTERESIALQRMYQNVKHEISSKEGVKICSESDKNIPLPPLLSFDISASLNGEDCFKNKEKILQTNPTFLKSGDDNAKINVKNESGNEISEDFLEEKHALNKLRKPILYQNEVKDDDEKIDVQRFSIVECRPNLQFPAFLKVSEETFIGSGENSEEEIVKSGFDTEDDKS